MSEQTYQGLVDALAAHAADEMDEYPLLTDWVLVAACVGGQVDETGYLHCASNSPTHSLEGLADRIKRRLSDDTPE